MKNNRLLSLDDNFSIDYQVVLGSGATGKVYQGFNRLNGQSVAIKVIDMQNVNTQVLQYLYKMELTALKVLNSPYVIKCLGIIEKGTHSFIITQFYNGSTLGHQIRQNGAFSQNKSLQLLSYILQGYQQILMKKIIHRDMKTDNIMLHNGIPKIIDFGYCQLEGYLKPQISYNVGSPSYMSPQSFHLNIYNQKTEIWAIGAIFYQCLTGKSLHKGQTLMNNAFNKLKNYGLILPYHISQQSIKLLYWCFNFDSAQRPTIRSLRSAVQQLRKPKKQKTSILKTIKFSENETSYNLLFESQNKNKNLTSTTISPYSTEISCQNTFKQNLKLPSNENLCIKPSNNFLSEKSKNLDYFGSIKSTQPSFNKLNSNGNNNFISTILLPKNKLFSSSDLPVIKSPSNLKPKKAKKSISKVNCTYLDFASQKIR